MTDHHQPDAQGPKPPTAKQLQYLRALAITTGQTFQTPRTRAQASTEINRLRTASRSHSNEDPRDHPAPSATAPRDDELAGYGATAHWA